MGQYWNEGGERVRVRVSVRVRASLGESNVHISDARGPRGEYADNGKCHGYIWDVRTVLVDSRELSPTFGA